MNEVILSVWQLFEKQTFKKVNLSVIRVSNQSIWRRFTIQKCHQNQPPLGQPPHYHYPPCSTSLSFCRSLSAIVVCNSTALGCQILFVFVYNSHFKSVQQNVTFFFVNNCILPKCDNSIKEIQKKKKV